MSRFPRSWSTTATRSTATSAREGWSRSTTSPIAWPPTLTNMFSAPPIIWLAPVSGGKSARPLAVRHPDLVSKLVLIAPSGFHGDENLPVMDGVRRSDYDSLVGSVFHRRSHFATESLVAVIEQKFQSRKWKRGILRTLRGTVGHSVADLLPQVRQPTLVIWGAEDQVISDVMGSMKAAERLPQGRQVLIPKCGHAPQIEKSRLVNTLVTRFLRDRLKSIPPTIDPVRALLKEARDPRALFRVAFSRA